LDGATNATGTCHAWHRSAIFYILRSDSDPSRHYVGRSSNVDERLDWHNAGPCGHTRQCRPWSIVVSLEFPDESVATRFERYLKSGSGRAFSKRHFAPLDNR